MNLFIDCKFIPLDLHLLEAPHAVQDVELLPAFGEVDLPVNEVRVPEVDEGQVLKNETPGRGRSCVKLWPSKKQQQQKTKFLGDQIWVLTFIHLQVRDAWGLHLS